MEISLSELNRNNSQVKNEKNKIINKGTVYDVPLFTTNDNIYYSQEIRSDKNHNQNNLFLRKDFNVGNYSQYKFNNANSEKTINVKTTNETSDYKHRITRLNIDSKNRNITPLNIITNESIYSNNPFSIIKNSNIITVKIEDHGFSQDDKITIENIVYPEFYLDSFELTKDSQYIKIYHENHGMLPFDTTKISTPYQIKIENIGNNNSSYFQNIPINFLNGYHTIYFNTNNSTESYPNFYYIKTDNIFPLETVLYDNIYYKVIYRHLYGIPIALITANYPITADRQNGCQIINSVIDKDTFTVVVDSIANYTVNNCGGDNVIINKIIDSIEGYPDNNHYKINLNKTFYNVSKIKLISTEFPNTEKTIKDYPLSKQNNLFYWQILNNVDKTYKVAITPGNYNIAGLITEIKSKIESTNIYDYENTNNTDIFKYDDTFKIDIIIDINSSIFQINFYGQISAVDPLKISQSLTDRYTYFLEVNQPSHLLSVGTKVRILNSLDIGKIPSTVINDLHTIDSIIDNDSYIIKLPRFNPLNIDSTKNTGGGLDVQIRYPIKTRLLFNNSGTIGNIIGFRNVGQINSITRWEFQITNNTPYQNDILVDSVGKDINPSIINNYINLNGDNYILMANPLFKNTLDTGNLNGVFAKLLLAGLPGYILFNQYIQLGDEFTEKVQSLSNLEFSFYSPDGTLYSFNGIDHSFTIEIYELISDNNSLNKKFIRNNDEE